MSSMDAKNKLSPYAHAVAGLGAGMIATITTYPLDLIKTRFQVQTKWKNATIMPTSTPPTQANIRYRSLAQALATVARTEGLAGLYAGFSPNLVGSGASWGLYFFFYNKIKRSLAGAERKELSAGMHLLAGAVAGVLVSTATNPIWVIKTRMQTQAYGDKDNYKGLMDGLWRLWREEGIRGLYRGYIPALFGVSHGAVQFMAYEELRKVWTEHLRTHNGDVQMGSLHYMAMGAGSKVFASVVTYPYQVIKSRLQVCFGFLLLCQTHI
ncbi:Solute carrier family 25 member 32, variant 2 [Balamuthia mandrillaris]